MISFFRRALSSWIVLALLGLILVAVAVTGIGTPAGTGAFGGLTGGGALVDVGSRTVTVGDLSSKLDADLRRQREQQPGLDMATFLRSGAFEQTLNESVDFAALQAFGDDHGLAISKRLIDGEIASISAFNGATGKFDEARFRQVLSSRGLTESRFRADVEQAIVSRHMLVPVAASSGAQTGIALPYASLALERRTGSVAAIPSATVSGGAMPTEGEITKFYARNAVKYTVPELRSVRYALFNRSRFNTAAAPNEAEIAAKYRKDSARYAARDMRGLTQIIVASQASADKIAAAVRTGQSMGAAAKSARLEALTLAPMERSSFASQSSPAVAAAAFAAQKNAVIPPVKSGLGWHIVRVDSVTAVSGMPLASARAAIVADLTKRNLETLLADFISGIDDAIADGQTFDEVVKAKGLAVLTTPDVTPTGIAPNQSGFQGPAELQTILRDAFQADEDDDPTVITISADVYALYDLERIVAAAPKPLAQIRTLVLGDFIADRAARAARKMAEAIAAKANSGTDFLTALSSAGVALPAPAPISARRLEITQAGQQVPPALSLLFSMAPRKAKVLEMPEKRGWFVVWLDRIEPGNAAAEPALVIATQRELADMVGQEYSQQFASAVKAKLKVKRNDAAITSLKRSLSGTGTK